ncbi:antibiotic biosynthesis monooxygenase [Streptomyces sp. SID7499]|uniref:Antibiotic biosynthesis monooxygenase n=1 Tax=Streptomyces sp. SID7499 TaxID=2706086 RepID=A0A6G3XQU3_9ACTN|nr:antibiotic biosynthesis monooxygenase [Streptomyces sp. SID7499]
MTHSPSDVPLRHVDDVGPDGGTTLITRVSEARVRPERFDAFRDLIVSTVRAFPDRHPGLVSHEVLLAPPGTLLYVSRWRSEEDLVAYAGEHWRDQPVLVPGEDEYLLAPLQVRHFTPATAAG